MKAVAFLVLALSNAGYWFGGQENTITIRPNLAVVAPADLTWELQLNSVRLGSGALAIEPGGKEAILRITPPAVRARTTLVWTYRLTSRQDKKELERGEQTVNVFPIDLGLAGVVREQKLTAGALVIWEEHDAVGKLLERAKASVTRVADSSKLQVLQPRVLLVGPDVLGRAGFDQGPLVALAESGVSVLIFQQTRCERLMGYTLARRRSPAQLEWRGDHPLLRGLEPRDLNSWVAGAADLWAVQLPPDAPALEIGYWPREAPGREPAPIDAVLLTRSVGTGRYVLCQIPLGDWERDPRSQILLMTALDYLMTRPEPTLPPSQRLVARQVVPATVPTIAIPSGDKP